MSVAASDLVFYGSANMVESDSGTMGGDIDASILVVPDSASLFNTLNDTIDIVSSASGDTSQTVTVTGRNTAGSIITEALALNGTSAVAGATTFERILKIVCDSSHTGTLTLTKNTGGSTIVAMPAAVLTVIRPFYNVSADASGGSARTFYSKIFLKNENSTKSLLGCTITETTDTEGQLTFAIEDAANDTGTTTNRLTAPAGGDMTGDGLSSSAKTIPGTDLAPTEYIGIWLELSLPAGDAATKTTYTLTASGSST